MLRTHTCGDLRSENIGEEVVLCGWVQRTRDKGGMLWVDLRDRYGVTQLSLEEGVTAPEVLAIGRELGREFVLKAEGTVIERDWSGLSIKWDRGASPIFYYHNDTARLTKVHVIIW